MQLIFDYLFGKIPAQQFVQFARLDARIPEWFQTLIPTGAEIIDVPYIPYHIENGEARHQSARSTHPFWTDVTVNNIMDSMGERVNFQDYFQHTKDFNTAGGRLDSYHFLFTLAKKKYPDLAMSNRYSEEFRFYLDVCGDTFDSPETEIFIDAIIFEVYNFAMAKTERKKIAKQRLRESFHIEGNKRPYWIHGSLWPMGKNTPMKYLSTATCGERKVYTFQDVDTGEKRDIEDFY